MSINIKKILKQAASGFGYDICHKKYNQKANEIPVDIAADKDFLDIYYKCSKYTMTGVVRMYSLYKAVEYIIGNNIEGDMVETGVWRGGSSMLVALTLKKHNVTNKKIYLYDTYEGMPEPTKNDINWKGVKASDILVKGTSG